MAAVVFDNIFLMKIEAHCMLALFCSFLFSPSSASILIYRTKRNYLFYYWHLRLGIWEPGLHYTNIAVKTPLAWQIVFGMVSKMVLVFRQAFLYDVLSRSQRTLKVNNFDSVDFQTQVFIWLLISWKFCTRIINKKGGTKEQLRQPVISLPTAWMQKCFYPIKDYELFMNASTRSKSKGH